jgi:hypothetical protein
VRDLPAPEASPVRELTDYFLTTDRRHAAESLAALESQALVHPVRVVRNVRPLRAALLQTLDCPTDYCLVVDDDVVLRPGIVPQLLDEFRRLRAAEPRTFKLRAGIYCEAKERLGSGGLKLLYTPHLLRVGWPDGTHLARVQRDLARRLGLVVAVSALEAGVQKRGTDLDLYQKYLWIELRGLAGQGRGADLEKLLRRARRRDQRSWWLAALGTLDARLVGPVAHSKDEGLRGPLAAGLELGSARSEVLSALVERELSGGRLGGAGGT